MLCKIVRRTPLMNQMIVLLKRWRRYVEYLNDYRKFLLMSQARQELELAWRDRYPCLDDRTSKTGFDRHYVFHTAWAARILGEVKPEKHVDISSSLYFCSIVSAFIPVDFYDYRPATLSLSNLNTYSGNILRLPFADNSVYSLSCMHVVEHIGLGRYGDPLDVDGDLKAIKELIRTLSENGTLLFVAPVGKSRIMFNAHRIYSYEQIIEYFMELKLVEFSLIPDNASDGGLIRNADPKIVKLQSYACGCFWFKKPHQS